MEILPTDSRDPLITKPIAVLFDQISDNLTMNAVQRTFAIRQKEHNITSNELATCKHNTELARLELIDKLYIQSIKYNELTDKYIALLHKDLQ